MFGNIFWELYQRRPQKLFCRESARNSYRRLSTTESCSTGLREDTSAIEHMLELYIVERFCVIEVRIECFVAGLLELTFQQIAVGLLDCCCRRDSANSTDFVSFFITITMRSPEANCLNWFCHLVVSATHSNIFCPSATSIA